MTVSSFKTFMHTKQGTLSLIGNTVLLGLLVWVQYSQINKFYAIFLVLYFVILLFLPYRSKVLFILPVLAVTITSAQVVISFGDIKNASLDAIQKPQTALENLFTPDSGQEFLPIQVQNMNSLLRVHNITTYQMSEQFNKDPLLYQRITELAWPTKMDKSSHYYFFSSSEKKQYSDCSIIDQREDVILAECP